MSSILGILYVPMIVLVICNLIDYGTGLCAAKYRKETVNSYKSLRGIAKKICQWLLVAIGAILDWLLTYSANYAGLLMSVNFVLASVVAVWLIANEILSILENMKDIGVPLPPFLEKLASNIKSQASHKEGYDESGSNNRNS